MLPMQSVTYIHNISKKQLDTNIIFYNVAIPLNIDFFLNCKVIRWNLLRAAVMYQYGDPIVRTFYDHFCWQIQLQLPFWIWLVGVFLPILGCITKIWNIKQLDYIHLVALALHVSLPGCTAENATYSYAICNV